MYALAKEHRNQKFLTKVRHRTPINIDVVGPVNLPKKDSLELNEICNVVNNQKKCLYRSASWSHNNNNDQDDQEEFSVQHKNMILYINSSWKRIQQELESNNVSKQANPSNGEVNSQSATSSISSSVSAPTTPSVSSSVIKFKHINGCQSKIPKNFVPFDLESFFGQRFIQKLLQST